MSAVFPVVEYRSALELEYDDAAMTYVPTWYGTISIDLRCVSSASRRETDEGKQWTVVTLAGSLQDREIDCPYEDFMRDWMRARGS
jgi:hypothetical protein